MSESYDFNESTDFEESSTAIEETNNLISHPTRKKRKDITVETLNSFIELIKQETKQTVIMRTLRLSKSAVYHLTRKYANGELKIEGFKSRSDKRRRKVKNHETVKGILAHQLGINPTTSLHILADFLFEETGIRYSITTIHRLLKEMKYSRKVVEIMPINRNSRKNKETRKIYCNDLALIRDCQLLFLDETGFNLHIAPTRGYSPVNSKCYINAAASSKSVNVSLLCVITNLGVLAYKIKIKAFNSEDLVQFLKYDLPLVSINERKYIIMDNATIHKTSIVSEAAISKNYVLKFLPPYSPQLNPIEEFFSSLKSRIAVLGPFRNQEILIQSIENVLESINNNLDFTGFVENMRKWVIKGINSEDFI